MVALERSHTMARAHIISYLPYIYASRTRPSESTDASTSPTTFNLNKHHQPVTNTPTHSHSHTHTHSLVRQTDRLRFRRDTQPRRNHHLQRQLLLVRQPLAVLSVLNQLKPGPNQTARRQIDRSHHAGGYSTQHSAHTYIQHRSQKHSAAVPPRERYLPMMNATL